MKTRNVLNHRKQNQLQVMTFNTFYYFFFWLCVYKHTEVHGKRILSTLAVARLSSVFVQITHKGYIRSLLADTLHKAGPSHKEKQQYQGATQGQNTKPCVIIFLCLWLATLSPFRVFSLWAEASCSWTSLENLEKFSLTKLYICYFSSELFLTFLCCLFKIAFVIDRCIPIIIPAVLHREKKNCMPYMHITIFLVPLVTGLNAKSQICCDISSAQTKM